ncbi:MAG: DNA methyltransferase [Methylophilus sp.]
MSRQLAYEPRNALNAICPYFTMFPLEYPLRVLKKHRPENPVVMDPFCGRGTTLFAARSLGLSSYGIDTSPVAVAIAQAKLSIVDSKSVLELAQSFIDTYDFVETPETDFFKSAFNPLVLKKICAIRQGLLEAEQEDNSAVLLRATVLGCLHGPTSKRLVNQSYFSNQMPRTFATKPDYSVKYWISNELIAPEVDVLSVLCRKLSRIENSLAPEGISVTDARLGDSRHPSSLPSSGREFSVVVTSPPYFGMRTYVEDQWLRNWFLGGPDHLKYGNSKQIEHTNKEVFTESLGDVWKNMARTNAEKLHMYIRFGIIPSSKTDPKALIHSSLESSGVLWKIISMRSASTASSGKRQANHMATGSVAAVEYDFHVCRI